MASVTASDWRNVMNLTSLSDTNAEYILDQAIDELNIYGANLDNMAGGAGSKTVTLTSKQRGAVFAVARMIYESYYKGLSNVNVGSMALTKPDLMSNPALLKRIEQIGHKLRMESYARIPFKVAEDETGYE